MKVSVNKILYHWYSKLRNNKSWEFQVSWFFSLQRIFTFIIDIDEYPIFEFNFLGLLKLHVYNSVREDHAGFNLNINILGLDIDLNHTDCRHWNYDEDRWETQEEIDQENLEYLNNKNQ